MKVQLTTQHLMKDITETWPCKCFMKVELTTQHLMKNIVETCGTTNDKAILELRDKCNWLNSEI